jgi:hypothetical protein
MNIYVQTLPYEHIRKIMLANLKINEVTTTIKHTCGLQQKIFWSLL